MSGLGLLLFITLFERGSFLVQFANSTSNESILSSVNKQPASTLSTEQSTPLSSISKPIQTTTPTTTTTSSNWKILRKECLSEITVCGILIVACTFFMMTTLLLTCKVCKLSRRITKLSHSAQLNSDSDFLETKKGRSKSGGEDKETTVLMSYVTQTNQELNSAATEQDGGKAEEDGQKPEDKKGEDSPKSEEAAAESSTFSQPQEDAPGSENTPAAAAAASSSEGTEEPNNQP